MLNKNFQFNSLALHKTSLLTCMFCIINSSYSLRSKERIHLVSIECVSFRRVTCYDQPALHSKRFEKGEVKANMKFIVSKF